jgi:hypothetical protein
MAKARGGAAVAERPARTKTVTKAKGAGGTDDLSAIVNRTKSLEDQERARTGSQLSWITLVQGNSRILQPDEAEYIKGVKMHDYVIPSRKLRIGPSIDATIVGMFKLYAEVTRKESEGDMAQTVSFWHPDDAEQIPTEGNFDRPLSNGNVLQPVHWVFLYLHDYPDIEDGLISFRSVGNSFYTALAKSVKTESAICPMLRWEITKQAVKNEKYRTTNYYPKFELSGRNFEYVDGKVTKTKGGLSDAVLSEVLNRYNKLYEDYHGMRLISKHNPAALISAPAKAATGKGRYADEEDEEGGTF